jgi:hypothetical protein
MPKYCQKDILIHPKIKRICQNHLDLPEFPKWCCDFKKCMHVWQQRACGDLTTAHNSLSAKPFTTPSKQNPQLPWVLLTSLELSCWDLSILDFWPHAKTLHIAKPMMKPKGWQRPKAIQHPLPWAFQQSHKMTSRKSFALIFMYDCIKDIKISDWK